MSSETRDPRRASAAWRIAGWPTVAFAMGSALAFALMYLLIAGDIRQRSDEWLSGEAETLADVSANTPRDSLYERLLQEVAELASHEVAPSTDSRQQNTVFFLQITPRLEPIWVGPQPKQRFIQQIENAHLVPGVPASLKVEGWKKPFRVVYRAPVNGGGIFLGFSDVAGSEMLERLTLGCLLAWAATVVLGFAVAWTVAHRTLARVVRITETVSEIGTEDLGRRLPATPVSDEISQLSHTFNRMLDRIQASVNQLHVLTDSVAHDLKSPVTSIRGSLEVALSDHTNGQWRERVAEAIEGLDRLSLMLNTTLDLAEADGGALRLHKEPVDLAGLVHQLIELYTPAMDMQSHKLQATLEPVMVEGDVALLNRAIANLLDNEVAHLPADRQISISLRPQAGYAVMLIEDSGPGFPRELRERVFERFVKGTHSTGHGLGLAFVDAVAQAHGGTVSINDRPGGGAIIVFSLPLAEVFTAKS